jgi:hypothetical protein
MWMGGNATNIIERQTMWRKQRESHRKRHLIGDHEALAIRQLVKGDGH